ncbi:iron-containing alcohol dehydrogenase family protein [Carnobacterium pleistocenium]|uniref:iron-containing alcohol dehydrogenase family protein n=1 Tax=Carnobacterium pleistocenium TaxID=181073 RepID=UPI00055579A1|nr:iron-containing alcohol dehydrogenase family protein [Carnobacterium pleistocenium]
MLTDLNVKGGPQFYRYSEGSIGLIPELLQEHAASRLLIVHGVISWEKAKPYLTNVMKLDKEIIYEQYNGECSYNECHRIAEIIKKNKIDFVIGVGGGKLSDTVLYACHLTNTQFGLIPTLASNCAPWAPLSVMYHDNGLAEGKSEHVKRQAAFLITDPALVIDSPVNYFIAGIADTLAKWYESDLILEQETFNDEPFPQMARFAARMCKEKVLAESEKAIADMRAKTISAEFIHISEIIFSIAGLVGGLGDKYARNTAAHAIHDAISAYLPEVHDYLHGEKVAYGIFYQLALEKKWSTIDELIPFYEALNLPKSLTEMGVYPMSEIKLINIVQLIDSKQKVHLLPLQINEESLTTALIDLEKYMTK